jgi:hypothetical protein
MLYFIVGTQPQYPWLPQGFEEVGFNLSYLLKTVPASYPVARFSSQALPWKVLVPLFSERLMVAPEEMP